MMLSFTWLHLINFIFINETILNFNEVQDCGTLYIGGGHVIDVTCRYFTTYTILKINNDNDIYLYFHR